MGLGLGFLGLENNIRLRILPRYREMMAEKNHALHARLARSQVGKVEPGAEFAEGVICFHDENFLLAAILVIVRSSEKGADIHLDACRFGIAHILERYVTGRASAAGRIFLH